MAVYIIVYGIGLGHLGHYRAGPPDNFQSFQQNYAQIMCKSSVFQCGWPDRALYFLLVRPHNPPSHNVCFPLGLPINGSYSILSGDIVMVYTVHASTLILQSVTEFNPGGLVATRSQQSLDLHSNSSLENEPKKAKVIFDYAVSTHDHMKLIYWFCSNNQRRTQNGGLQGLEPTIISQNAITIMPLIMINADFVHSYYNMGDLNLFDIKNSHN